METMEEIYRAHARTVYKFLLSLCHDPETAEELTQETFYQAVRSADRFDGSCKVSTWLCQIAKHLFYQHVRKRSREEPLPEEDDGSVEDQLGRYFTARMTFFQENPVYQPIFCEAVISPPARLFEQIQARRKAFDALTISTLKHLLRQLPLRTDITMEEVVDLFRQFQDFINAQAQASSMPARKCFALRDAQCRRLLTVLLYGVTERGDRYGY